MPFRPSRTPERDLAQAVDKLRHVLAVHPLPPAHPLLAANTLNAAARALDRMLASLPRIPALGPRALALCVDTATPARPFAIAPASAAPLTGSYDELGSIADYVDGAIGPAGGRGSSYDWTTRELACAYAEFTDKAELVRGGLARRLLVGPGGAAEVADWDAATATDGAW